MIAAIITLSILEILTIIIMLAGYERMLIITTWLKSHNNRLKELEHIYDRTAGSKNIPAVEHNK